MSACFLPENTKKSLFFVKIDKKHPFKSVYFEHFNKTELKQKVLTKNNHCDIIIFEYGLSHVVNPKLKIVNFIHLII